MFKNNLSMLLFLLSASCIGQELKLDSLLADFYDRPEIIMVAAHRAAHQRHPENSLAAVQESIRLGIDIIEIDLRMSKDGKFVLMHDSTVDRTTNGTGSVSDLRAHKLHR
ncbi:glycerophosphodiester phosphodiesterase family protein [Pricia sp. S334]|uniref:Glycerophosphodiester phosphodiesterase family protein n=1 Tax=Pricia mediterranea TaxID=3076079 RepID=A0ABU3L4X4_9FLAO|nr:glycerophosphodiester phosphodiesterase family protein [Pricia sp. S334]MDT7828799.1 glycerophosphodiester phosphodiesterase family protein [Pricia sp. S334]